jgi:FtsZ-binding cell division protein ZapB
MISLDQVLLLQQKVETAVEKIKTLKSEISQLESENDALRRKCAELTNSLEDKTGLVSSLEAEQNQIEETILKALDQLDAVEDRS